MRLYSVKDRLQVPSVHYHRLLGWIKQRLTEEFWYKTDGEKQADMIALPWAWRPTVIRNRLRFALRRSRPH